MAHELYSKNISIYRAYSRIRTLQRPILNVTIVHNLMRYSNKCLLFCTREHSAGGKRGGKICESLLKPVNKDGYDATGDKIEIYMRIMDSVHY